MTFWKFQFNEEFINTSIIIIMLLLVVVVVEVVVQVIYDTTLTLIQRYMIYVYESYIILIHIKSYIYIYT